MIFQLRTSIIYNLTSLYNWKKPTKVIQFKKPVCRNIPKAQVSMALTDKIFFFFTFWLYYIYIFINFRVILTIVKSIILLVFGVIISALCIIFTDWMTWFYEKLSHRQTKVGGRVKFTLNILSLFHKRFSKKIQEFYHKRTSTIFQNPNFDYRAKLRAIIKDFKHDSLITWKGFFSLKTPMRFFKGSSLSVVVLLVT